MRRRKQQPDSGFERRVVVSVDADPQQLVVAGSEGDMEQAAGEFEYVRSASSDLSPALHVQAILVLGIIQLFWRPAFDE